MNQHELLGRSSEDLIKLPPTPKDLTRHRLTKPHELLLVVMCGLPARGKSFLSKKIHRFLAWRGEQVKIFNVGERRRKHSTSGAHDASFFGASNRNVREEIAQGVLNEARAWAGAEAISRQCLKCFWRRTRLFRHLRERKTP